MANRQLPDFLTAENDLDGQELAYIAQNGKTRKSTLQKIKDWIIGTTEITTTADTVTGAIEEVKGIADNNTAQLNDVAQNLTKHKNALVTDIGGVHGLRVESGTFTPILAGRTIAGINTYSYQQGAYYRIGNIVHFALLLATSAIDAGVSGGIEIRGLPFVLKDSSQVAFTICPNGFTLPEGYSWIGAYSTASSSAINLTLHGNDKNGTFITNNQLTQTVELRISGCYKI